jgi:hypothetical protein
LSGLLLSAPDDSSNARCCRERNSLVDRLDILVVRQIQPLFRSARRVRHLMRRNAATTLPQQREGRSWLRRRAPSDRRRSTWRGGRLTLTLPARSAKRNTTTSNKGNKLTTNPSSSTNRHDHRRPKTSGGLPQLKNVVKRTRR